MAETDVDGTCEYVLDPDDPETWGGEEGDECYVDEEALNEDGVWSCPHDAEEDEDLCIFHLSVNEKDDDKVVDTFLDTLDEATASDDSTTQERKLQFLGAEFGVFDMNGAPPEIVFENAGIDMSYVEISGVMDWSQVTFDVRDLRLIGAKFRGDVKLSTEYQCGVTFRGAVFLGESIFSVCKFEQGASFMNSIFYGESNFYGATFDRVSFSGAEFKSDVTFARARFKEDANFRMSKFIGDSDFSDAVFNEDANFDRTEFRGEADFSNTVFETSIGFSRMTCKQRITYSGAKFGGNSHFDRVEFEGYTNFSRTEFNEDANFWQSMFDGEGHFSEADFGGNVDFHQANISCVDFEGVQLEGTDFSNAVAKDALFRDAHLADTDFEHTDLSGTDLERAKLSDADLFGTDLSGAHLYGARIGDAAINTDTVFDRYGEHRCVYDPNSEYEYESDDEQVGQLTKAMGAYHVLEQLTRANTLPDEQAAFFVRRQDMRRAQLREDGRRLEYWFAEAQNAIFRHGESFSRVVVWSLGAIVAFALLYPLGGWLQSESTGTITYKTIGESPVLLWKSLHHSALLFLTGGGPLTPTGVVGEVLTTIEALIAPILLALLVFVLGRRAAR